MRRTITFLFVVLALGANRASAQSWTFDPRASSAWWQINPHLGHLWATTCPQDETWQPGESRGNDENINKATRKEVSIVNDDDPRVPVYPRDEVRPVCSEAVTGSITARDTTSWSGLKGVVSVKTQFLYGGMEMRDDFARRSIYSTTEYPEVRFNIDSVVNVRRGRDTLHAEAIGMFEFRGVRAPMSVPVTVTRADNGRRISGRFSFPAKDLTGVFRVSQFSLGLGLATHIWKTVHMGFDLVLVPPGTRVGG